jgi:hypothetical protein
MGILPKKPAAEPFRVPSLAEASTDYAALVAKRSELQTRQLELSRERRTLEKAIAADTSRETPTRVAELLGDRPGSKSLNRKRVAEIASVVSDIETAVSVVDQRIRDAKGAASQLVCAAARPEYARRVKAMVDAAKLLDAAHKHYDDLRFAFEAEDVSWGSLIPMTPAFLGSSMEPDRRLARFVRDAVAAGYGN